MMEKLYSQKRYLELEKIKKKYQILGLVFLGSFAITLLVFLLCATYQTRVVMNIICAVLSTAEVLVSLFFFIKMGIFKRICREFNILLTAQYETKKIEFLDISLKPITLSDKSKAYVVKVRDKNGNQTLYLSSLFNGDEFKPNEHYKILTAFEYIVGYEHER